MNHACIAAAENSPISNSSLQILQLVDCGAPLALSIHALNVMVIVAKFHVSLISDSLFQLLRHFLITG